MEIWVIIWAYILTSIWMRPVFLTAKSGITSINPSPVTAAIAPPMRLSRKGVCGKLDVAAGTGVVWPEEEEKTNVVVRLVDGPNLVVTFTEWPSLSADDPPGATLWKM